MIVILDGLHRSGTTLLSRLMDALPHTFIITDGLRIPWHYFRVETRDTFIYPIDLYRSPLRCDLNKEIRDPAHLVRSLAEKNDKLLLTDEIRRGFEKILAEMVPGDTYKQVFSRLFDCMAQVTGAQCVGAKNTNMGRYAANVLDAFPDLKWICVVRDPRAWRCSIKRSHPMRLLMSTRIWNTMFDAAVNVRRRYPDRTMMVSYETLVLKPVGTLQKLCDFLAIDHTVTTEWIDSLQLTDNDGSPWFANSSFRRSGQGLEADQINQGQSRAPNEYRVLDPMPLFRWREDLPAWEKALIGVMTHKRRALLETST